MMSRIRSTVAMVGVIFLAGHVLGQSLTGQVDTPHCETNYDLSYMRSPNLKDWETVDGQPLALPIKSDSAGVVVDPVPAGGGIINGGFRQRRNGLGGQPGELCPCGVQNPIDMNFPL